MKLHVAKLQLLVIYLTGLLVVVYGQATNDQSRNCVFIGCTCGEDAYTEVFDSKENVGYEQNAIGALPASMIAYDIDCHDEYDPTARMKYFPMRDMTRRYSHQVSTLEMNDNAIESVPADQFEGLEVIIADLSSNALSEISPDAFRGIIKLEILDLSKNHLRELDENTFKPIESSLIQLKLTSNELNYTDINKLGSMLSALNRLTFLGLRHNHLTRMPDLSKMTRLEELAFESNLLESLGEEEGAHYLPSTLVDLRLENNRLRHIHDNTFSNLHSLKYLNLASNQISSISANAFTHLTHLHTLNLRKNQLNHIPSRIFFTLVNLERLDLSSQHQILKQIDNYAFDRQSNHHTMRKIDLSNNRISTIDPKAFCSRNHSHPYINVKEIDLASNHLKKPINACQLRQLSKGYRDIKQHHNHNSRPRISFKSSSHSNELALYPMKCDCEVTRSVNYVDFTGQCENSDGALVHLKNFKCNNDEARSHDAVELLCFNMHEFDCKHHKNDANTPHYEVDEGAASTTGGQETSGEVYPTQSNGDYGDEGDDKKPLAIKDGSNETPSLDEKNMASKGPSESVIRSSSNTLASSFLSLSLMCSLLFLAIIFVKQC